MFQLLDAIRHEKPDTAVLVLKNLHRTSVNGILGDNISNAKKHE